jgi:hypothetical protein
MLVLDIYDDPTASILARRLAEAGVELQEKLASSTLLPHEDLQALPDRLFALVARGGDGSIVRKYAMHDAPHVLTSIAYFMECGRALKPELQEKVATTLVNACAWYNIEPPSQLVRSALTKEARQVVEAPSESWDPIEAALKGTDKPKQDAKALPAFQATKVADSRGTALGAQGAMRSDPRGKTPESKGLMPKVSQLELAAPERPKQAGAERYALPDAQKYPIDSSLQVKMASRYFEEHSQHFGLAERYAFARNVAQRAEELGVKVASSITALGGTGYGDFIRQELEARVRCFDGLPKQAAYNVLLEKVASVSPEEMREQLARVDAATGIDRGYDRPGTGFRDPYMAVYGTKVAAEAPYEWIHEGHYCSESDLRRLAKTTPELDRAFGPGFTTRFVKDPVAAFRALGTDQKVVLCRLVNEASRTP